MKLSVSKSARWTALLIVSITMMFGYFFTDVMSPLEPLLTAAKGAENGLGLGWNSDEYGFFSGAYGYFNVFLLLLFFGGLILDKFGIRFTGILSTVLMFGGALLKWYALGHEFDGMVAVPFFGTYSTQVVIAALGFAIYGVGCEICGITVSKVIVKWFTGHELALAMGVQVATARLGTAAALSASLPFAKAMGGVSASVALGAVLSLCWCTGISGLLCDGQEGGCFCSSCSYRTGREVSVFRLGWFVQDNRFLVCGIPLPDVDAVYSHSWVRSLPPN